MVGEHTRHHPVPGVHEGLQPVAEGHLVLIDVVGEGHHHVVLVQLRRGGGASVAGEGGDAVDHRSTLVEDLGPSVGGICRRVGVDDQYIH